jgi:2-polyprenyl-3-methyl-5-hydroxy-6-metoxy-1,4-benzoquinol methylase
MNDGQSHMITDLRYPKESRNPLDEDRWSQWRLLPIIELSAQETYQFVKAMIPQPNLKILEVGCGNGYLSLELARDGHKVIGLDKSPEIIQAAEGTKLAHPATPDFGELTYVCADIGEWQAEENSFDVVIINRTLHHLHHLQPTLTKVKQLLKNSGRLICQDYAYDRFSEQTASWMYSMQRMLFLGGLSDEDLATTANDARAIEGLRTAWFQRAEQRTHRLNRYDEMIQAFRANFQEELFSWMPYLFVYIGNTIRHATAEQEDATITFLRNIEQYLIEKEYIQAVGFRYVGSRF